MSLLDIEFVRSDTQSDLILLNRLDSLATNKPQMKVKPVKRFADKIDNIETIIANKLGHHEGEYQIIRSELELMQLIERISEVGLASIDTETTSKDSITTTLVGTCIAVDGTKPAYIPHNHISHITQKPIKGQIPLDIMAEHLAKVKDIKWVMHNGKFDLEVIQNNLGLKLFCYWDTFLAHKCINELDSAALKDIQFKYCNSTDPESYTYKSLFGDVPFCYVSIETAHLYAAGDPAKTLEVYKFQEKYFQKHPETYYVFSEIEMELLPVIVDIGLRGIHIDTDFADNLKTKYSKMLKTAEEDCHKMLKPYEQIIKKTADISWPVNLASPLQIAALFYDIFQVPVVNRHNPRGTGKEILSNINHPFAPKLLEYRRLEKLMSTYIEAIPNSINPKSGVVHTEYNQMGTDTGRMSSSNPNLANIPSKNKDIRKMFIPAPGNVFVGSDYSQQEPRVLAFLSQDKALREVFLSGQDLYSSMVSKIDKKPLAECLESYSKAAKSRRGIIKTIWLGILYGRSAKKVADDLKISVKEAQAVINSIYETFPGVKIYMDYIHNFVTKNGYVETICGRRRHFPNAMLLPYEVSGTTIYLEDDPLTLSEEPQLRELDYETKLRYSDMISSASFRERENIINSLTARGFKVKNNSGFVAEAKRQAFNAAIQGSAADMTKLATIRLYKDTIMTQNSANMVLSIYDELIVECPQQFSNIVSERLVAIMIETAASLIDVPMKCDAEITNRWYENE